MAVISFEKKGDCVKITKDGVVKYTPGTLLPWVKNDRITFKFSGVNRRYDFKFYTTDTITVEGEPLTGTAAEICQSLLDSCFNVSQ